MIRTDCSDIDDETFLNVVLPANEAVKKYFVEKHLYDYVASYLAIYFKMDAMWTCKMSQEVNSALCSLCNFEETELDYNKIKKLLKEKHGLIVTNEEPLEIELM